MKINWSSPSTTPEDMAKSRSWTAPFFSTPGNLPVSFVYAGQLISGIPVDWKPVSNRRRIDGNIFETVFEGRHPATGLHLKLEWLEYCDFPVVEWTVWLTNHGTKQTPIISDLLALNSSFAGSSPVLYHCNGDYFNQDGYTPIETPLQAGEMLRFAPTGGRPCNEAFPYYRINFADCGLTLAVGWPGQWSASYTASKTGVEVKVGQEKTHLSLMPGETIRTPRITMMSWMGDSTRAVNLWRRWYLAHVLPRPNGRPMQPLHACAGTDSGEEFTDATEENQVRLMDKFKKVGFDFDVWWIDAGWYLCYNENRVWWSDVWWEDGSNLPESEKEKRRWWLTGSWEPDAGRFPNGLKPISDNALKNEADLLVWFEPERVTVGSQLDKNHPEWLLKTSDGFNRLLNLGNPQCRIWLTDHISKLIQDNGIKIYRQDFNFPPLAFWRENDAEDRQGMNENLHVQGYLQFWDEILERNPGLWIDSCSSGGRRNDMETMRRSVPLHYTDYGYGNHAVKLSFHHTLFEWIPYFKECTLSWDVVPQGGDTRFDFQIDSFGFHCGMAAMLFTTIDIHRDDYDFALGVKLINIWRRAAEYLLYGDYYPQTPFSSSPERWVAWQFADVKTDSGFLQAIRHKDCVEDSITLHAQGLSVDAEYELENPETCEKLCVSGSILSGTGFTISLPKRSGVIWFYSRK